MDEIPCLTPEEVDTVMRMIRNPPTPTPAMIALMHDYMKKVADGRLITDTTSPEEAREWLRLESLKS